jgi:chromosome segregation ATPase
MAEEIERASDRQATWVALRTLRQRPTLVGKTDDGAAVYEIRSVRLLLAPGATHFRRLVTCARCGRDVPGSPVLAPADLERPANSVFCERCVRSPVPPRPEVAREREDPPARVPPPPPPPPQRATAPAINAGDLQRLSEQVADLLLAQNGELANLSAAVAEVRTEMRELGESNRALERAQHELEGGIVELAARVDAHPGAELETRLARELIDVRASLAARIDATAQPLQAVLADGLNHLRAEMASLQSRVDESAARSEVEQIVEANRRLARVQGELDERLREVAARPEPDPEAVGALDLLRAEVARLELRMDEASAAFTDRLETQRRELAEALQAEAREALTSVAEPLRDVTNAREDFERRLGDLQQRAEALSAAADARASREHALEQMVESTAQQLARLIEVQAQAAPPAPGGRSVTGGIMDSLERQLRAAELRLLHTSSDAGES